MFADIKDRLRFNVENGLDQEALACIEAQEARIVSLEIESDTFQHGYRIASENCVRLEGILEQQDAEHILMGEIGKIIYEASLEHSRSQAWRATAFNSIRTIWRNEEDTSQQDGAQPTPDAIVKATLEAAKLACTTQGNYVGSYDFMAGIAYAHKNVCAIDHATIIQAAKDQK
jgi:hypothetical protein